MIPETPQEQPSTPPPQPEGEAPLDSSLPPPPEIPPEPPPRKIPRPAIIALIVFLALTGILFWWHARRVHWLWEPIPMPERLARVYKDWPVETLAKRMQETKKVRDAATFVQAAREVGLVKVAAGGYLLPKMAGPLDLARIFRAGPTHQRVTFPEGWTAYQMSDRFAAVGFKAATEFRQLAYPANEEVSPWEGRLFPDTYFLPLKNNAKQLAVRLQDRFNEIAKVLPRPFPKGADGKELSLAQVVTLASLVERETFIPDERPLIAGVLLNRLRQGMRLQCDASVQYVLTRASATEGSGQAHKVRLLYSDLHIDSPYNTYRYVGLPPGPICNPGAASLRAAATPQASNYLFYVMSPALHRHRFATTFAEHQHNIRLAKQEATP